MKQYELRWATLPLPVGRRPVLLLTRTAAYRYLEWVLVAEVTSRIRGIPQEVLLGRREGLAHESVANLDNVHSVEQTRIGDLIGQLPATREPDVKRALGFVLAWQELTGR